MTLLGNIVFSGSYCTGYAIRLLAFKLHFALGCWFWSFSSSHALLKIYFKMYVHSNKDYEFIYSLKLIQSYGDVAYSMPCQSFTECGR